MPEQSLVAWIRQLLRTPDSEWRKYTNFLDRLTGLSDEQKEVCAALRADTPKYSVTFPEGLVEQLFDFVRHLEGSEHLESEIWPLVIRSNAEPLPKRVGLALSEPPHAQSATMVALANSYQSMEVWFGAADQDKYARSRLCLRLFVSADHEPDLLVRFMERYGREGAVRILTARKPSSSEKLAVFTETEVATMKGGGETYARLSRAQQKKRRKRDRKAVYLQERAQEEERIAERQQSSTVSDEPSE